MFSPTLLPFVYTNAVDGSVATAALLVVEAEATEKRSQVCRSNEWISAADDKWVNLDRDATREFCLHYGFINAKE